MQLLFLNIVFCPITLGIIILLCTKYGNTVQNNNGIMTKLFWWNKSKPDVVFRMKISPHLTIKSLTDNITAELSP